MATQLLIVPSRLKVLTSKLGRDRDLQTQIDNVARKAKTAAKSFKSAISHEGSTVLLQKTLLMTGSPDNYSISDIHRALYAANEAFSATKELVVGLQTDIHSSIELCRGRKVHYESELADILARMTNMWSEIESLEVIVTTHEDEVTALVIEAAELNKREEDVKRSAKKKRKEAEKAGLIGGIVGIALAPFTGGASLALATAASGISAAVNLTSAEECGEIAKKLRSDADRKKEKAEKLKSQKAKLMKQRSALESEMRAVQSRTEHLTEAVNVFQQVTSFLLPTINAIDILVHAFQDIDTAIKEVSLQNNSFEIIRNVLSCNTDSSDGCAEKYMDQLKEKWEHLEDTLIQHGAQDMKL